MKKSVLVVFLAFVLITFIFSFAIVKADDNDSSSNSDSGSDSENSGSSDDGTSSNSETQVEHESETETEVKDDGSVETKTKEKVEIQYANGTKLRYEYELRERRELSEEEERDLFEERNRLEIHTRTNQTLCPQNCSCEGSTIKCEYFDPERNQTRRELTIHAGNSNNTIIQIKEANASTRVMLYRGDDGRVYGNFSNGTMPIILPDEVRERIEAEIRARLQNESINLTLDEQGKYQVEARKRARLFFIIPVQERVQAQVDAETGEIIRERNSWWGFLARDDKIENPEDNLNETNTTEENSSE